MHLRIAEVTSRFSFNVVCVCVCDENSLGEEQASAFVRFETRPILGRVAVSRPRRAANPEL